VTNHQSRIIKVAVSGIPRGYQFPLQYGNWLQEKHKEKIRAISPNIELVEIPAYNSLNNPNVEGVEILLAEGGNRTHYSGELDWEDYLNFFTPSLKWVQLCSTGFSDNITNEIKEGKVTLTNMPNLHTNPIAESVIAAMLDHAKSLKQRRTDQKNKQWNQLKNDELYSRTALLIGLGNIGKRVARLCKAFDMKVIGTKRNVMPVDYVDKVFPLSELNQYLPEADYIVVLVPHTSETEKMLGEQAFKVMKKSAYLINLGRGKVIDEQIMTEILREERITGAFLDCFTEEPLPETSELWNFENVLISPHDSHSSPYIGDRTVDNFCGNLKRYINGESLNFICDPERGY
jgi:phosphoglycerate dehydrogenase-like enzyme